MFMYPILRTFMYSREGPLSHNAIMLTWCVVEQVGPCSSDGNLALPEGGEGGPLNLTLGRFSRPFCPIRSHNRQCLDVEGERIWPGTSMIGYPCTMKWNQLFSFGDNPTGTIFISIPYNDHEPKRLCLETSGSYPSELKTAACIEGALSQQFIFQDVF